jgi:uncharacterized protein (DUF58 family)
VATRRPGFTTRGSCLLAAGLTAVLCGFALGTADLVRAGLLAVVLPLIAAVLVHRSTLRFSERRRADPATSAAGQPVQIHLQLSNESRLPTASLMLEDLLPAGAGERARFVLDALGSREQRVITYTMPELPRGRYRAGPLRAKLTDPFHLVEVVRVFEATSSFVVTPIIEALSAAEPPRSYDVGENAGSHSVGAHGADDASTREYRTGDDLRKIHWRSTARTGALMVRQEERPWQGQVSVLLDTRKIAHGTRLSGVRPGGDIRADSSLEWSVSAAASVCARLLQAGREVGLMTEPSWPERHDYSDAHRMAEYLGMLRASPVPDLSALASVLRAAGRDSALVAIVGRLDAASLEVLAGARPRGSAIPAFAMIVDADSWLPDERPTQPGHLATDAVEVLRAAGWRTSIVRRGDTVSDAWAQVLRSTQDIPIPTLEVAR